MRKNNSSSMQVITQITKFWLSLAVSLTTLAGFIVFSPKLTFIALWVSFGVFFLSAAAAVLNQYQERLIDAKMERTKNRPLPSGIINSKQALWVVLFLLSAGVVFLGLTKSYTAILLGIGNLLWYNFIYTPLKQKTAFAAIPGALCGAIPPIIGWIAAGGYLLDKQILVLALFMFMWQVPHFWLVLLKYGTEYQKAGLATLNSLLSAKAIRNITFIWGLSCGTGAIVLTLYGLISNSIYKVVLVIAFYIFALLFVKALFSLSIKRINYPLAFTGINSFMLLVLILVVFDKFA